MKKRSSVKMKKRSPLTVLFLSIVTFGIYDVYWLVVTKNVLNRKTKQNIPSIWILIFPFITFISGYVIYGISGAYNQPSTMNCIPQMYYTCPTDAPLNSNINENLYITGAIIILVSGVTFLITSLIWFFKFSKAINEYTKGKMSTAVSFLVLWLIQVLGVALIQDAINEQIDSKNK